MGPGSLGTGSYGPLGLVAVCWLLAKTQRFCAVSLRDRGPIPEEAGPRWFVYHSTTVSFVEITTPRRRVWPAPIDTDLTTVCLETLEAELRRIYGEYDWVYDLLAEQKNVGRLRGRMPVMTGTVGAEDAVVKRLWHGGSTAELWKDRFLSTRRVRSFVTATEYLLDRGVHTPRLLFASWRRLHGTIRSELGFERIEGKDADHFFFERSEPPSDWEGESRKVGELVASLHRVGFVHGDLNLMNVFLRTDGTVFILDLDKARHHDEELDDLTRERNLARLGRSIRKQGRDHPAEYVGAIIRLAREGYLERVESEK